MKSPQRQEILAALNVDHAKRKKAPIVKEKWVDPED